MTSEFKNINYKKITFKDKEKLTPELISEMYKIDTIIRSTNLKEYSKKLNKLLQKKNYNFYYIYNKDELLGCIIGHKKDKYTFFADYFFIHPKYQTIGLGTKLMARLFADIRVKEKLDLIEMYPLEVTARVNERLVGLRKFKTNKLREMKNTKVKYEMDNLLRSSEKHRIYIVKPR